MSQGHHQGICGYGLASLWTSQLYGRTYSHIQPPSQADSMQILSTACLWGTRRWAQGRCSLVIGRAILPCQKPSPSIRMDEGRPFQIKAVGSPWESSRKGPFLKGLGLMYLAMEMTSLFCSRRCLRDYWGLGGRNQARLFQLVLHVHLPQP